MLRRRMRITPDIRAGWQIIGAAIRLKFITGIQKNLNKAGIIERIIHIASSQAVFAKKLVNIHARTGELCLSYKIAGNTES